MGESVGEGVGAFDGDFVGVVCAFTTEVEAAASKTAEAVAIVDRVMMMMMILLLLLSC